MAHGSTIQFRLNAKTKDKSYDVFRRHGLTLTDGLRIYLERVASIGEIPFPLNIPNAQTQKAIVESEQGEGNSKFESSEEMFKHLDELTK